MDNMAGIVTTVNHQDLLPPLEPRRLLYTVKTSRRGHLLRWAPRGAYLPASLQDLLLELPITDHYDGITIDLHTGARVWKGAVFLGEQMRYLALVLGFQQKIRYGRVESLQCEIAIAPFVKVVCERSDSSSSIMDDSTSLQATTNSLRNDPMVAFSQRLPVELQEFIWALTLPNRQFFWVKHMTTPGLCIASPPLLSAFQICRKSRAVALRRFKPLPRTDRDNEPRQFYCDVTTDILWLDDISTTEWCSLKMLHSHFKTASHPWKLFCTIALNQYLGNIASWAIIRFPGIRTIFISDILYPHSEANFLTSLHDVYDSQGNCHTAQQLSTINFKCSPKLKLNIDGDWEEMPDTVLRNQITNDERLPDESYSQLWTLSGIVEDRCDWPNGQTIPRMEFIHVRMHCKCVQLDVLQVNKTCHPAL